MVPQYLIYVGVALAIVARFAVRELRERRVRLARLFIVPAVAGIAALGLVYVAALAAPQDVLALALLCLAALGAGAAIGLAVARFTTVRVDPDVGTVFVRGSYATLAIWIAALALRWVARRAVGTHDLGATTVANAALVVLLAVALGVVRYRILIEARIARARGITSELTAL